KAPCLFVQGACGDINPCLDKTPLSEGAEKAVLEEGNAAAKAVLLCHKATEAIAPKSVSVAYRETRVPVGTRWDLSNVRQAEILRSAYGPMYEVYLAPFAEDPAVPVGV